MTEGTERKAPGGREIFLTKSVASLHSQFFVFNDMASMAKRFANVSGDILNDEAHEEGGSELHLVELDRVVEEYHRRSQQVLLTEHKSVSSKGTVHTRRAFHSTTHQALEWCAKIAREVRPMAGRMTDIELVSKFTQLPGGKQAFVISIVGRE